MQVLRASLCQRFLNWGQSNVREGESWTEVSGCESWSDPDCAKRSGTSNEAALRLARLGSDQASSVRSSKLARG